MLPFLQSWSKNALVKLQYALETKTYLRNSVIYKEGEPSTNVYIIKSGEFEMLKKVKEVKSGAEAGKIDSLIHGNGTQSSMSGGEQEITSFKDFIKHRGKSEENKFATINQSVPNKKKLLKNDDKLQLLANSSKIISKGESSTIQNSYKIAQIGIGQLFGEEDVISQRHYSTTVVCKSKVAEVFAIKSDEFTKKFKSNIESWGIILLMTMAKEKAIYERVKKLKQLIRKNEPANIIGEQIGSSLGVSLLKETQLLINRNEVDLRERFKEIINEYPSVDNHRKLLQEDNNAKDKDHLKKRAESEEKFFPKEFKLKKTIEINLEAINMKKPKLLPDISTI